jgi:hypothetical protein
MSNINIGSLCLLSGIKKNMTFEPLLNSVVNFDISMSEKIYYFWTIYRVDCYVSGSPRKYIGFKNGYRPTCGNKRMLYKY